MHRHNINLKGLPATGRPATIKPRVLCLHTKDKVSFCCDGSSIGIIGFSGHLIKWQLTLVNDFHRCVWRWPFKTIFPECMKQYYYFFIHKGPKYVEKIKSLITIP